MKFADFVVPAAIRADLTAEDKEGVIREMVQSLLDAGAIENDEFERTLRAGRMNRLIVGGVALEYCVKATCVDAIVRGFDVVAVMSMIASVSQDARVIHEHWEELRKGGVTLVRDWADGSEVWQRGTLGQSESS